MIINSQRKVMLYNVPRTGTLSIVTAAQNARNRANVPLNHVTESHVNYQYMRNMIESGEGLIDHNQNISHRISPNMRQYNEPLPMATVEELDSYEQYVFVRDPFERAKSAINLFRRGRLHHILLTVHYGHDFRIPCTQRDDDYDNFPQKKKDAINRIPYIQTFRHLKWWFARGSMYMGHHGFIEGPVQPLQFSDFGKGEARRIMGRLGIPANVELPHVNGAKYIPEYDGLSPSEEQEIKEFFASDYEYLDSKGIHYTR